MSYRPITDMWLLARAKLKGGKKYYGAYLGGFPERARALLGVTINDPVLHVCGGMARHYPYAAGFGPNDKTLDLDPLTQPDFLGDAALYSSYPVCAAYPPIRFKAMLADPPYSPEDARHYAVGAEAYPAPNQIVKNMIASVEPGQRVGIIHYILPACPKNAKFVACVGVVCGFNNRIRVFSVFEKVAE